jgi:hypothetical protein
VQIYHLATLDHSQYYHSQRSIFNHFSWGLSNGVLRNTYVCTYVCVYQ